MPAELAQSLERAIAFESVNLRAFTDEQAAVRPSSADSWLHKLVAQRRIRPLDRFRPLGFLIEDYILHMQHHLDYILGRERITQYPGTAAAV